MWDERTGGTYPRASARKGYASGRDSGPMGLGRTLGLDASHVDGPRHGGERRSVAHQRWPNAFFDAQGLFSLHAAQRAFRRPPMG